MNISKLLTLFAWGSFAAILLIPLGAGAADGDNCRGGTNRTAPAGYDTGQCYLLCDSDADPGGACSEFRFRSVPDLIQIEIAEDDGCTAGLTATFTTRGNTAADSHTLSGWALTRGGTTSRTLSGETNQPLTYIIPTLGTATNCTDIDLKMHVFHRR